MATLMSHPREIENNSVVPTDDLFYFFNKRDEISTPMNCCLRCFEDIEKNNIVSILGSTIAGACDICGDKRLVDCPMNLREIYIEKGRKMRAPSKDDEHFSHISKLHHIEVPISNRSISDHPREISPSQLGEIFLQSSCN